MERHARPAARLLRKVAAVDHQLGAGDVARLITGQEQTAVGDFDGLAAALHRRGSDDSFVECGRLRLRERRVDEAGMHRIKKLENKRFVRGFFSVPCFSTAS